MDSPAEQLRKYETDGFVGPFTAFDAVTMNNIAAQVRELVNHDLSFAAKRNRHLDWEVAKYLVGAPSIVEIAKRILGPDLVLWRTQFFISETDMGIRWHRDEYKALLADPMNQLSIHLGITASTEDNCLSIVPGSHRMTGDQLAESGFNYIQSSERNAYGTSNFWREPDGAGNIMKILLRPGEFFAFHPMLVHASYDLTVPPGAAAPQVPMPAEPVSGPRMGLGIRITASGNRIFDAAFAETRDRGDHAVQYGH